MSSFKSVLQVQKRMITLHPIGCRERLVGVEQQPYDEQRRTLTQSFATPFPEESGPKVQRGARRGGL